MRIADVALTVRGTQCRCAARSRLASAGQEPSYYFLVRIAPKFLVRIAPTAMEFVLLGRFFANAATCSSVCRFSFGRAIHSRMIFRRVSWSFMFAVPWLLSVTAGRGMVGHFTTTSGGTGYRQILHGSATTTDPARRQQQESSDVLTSRRLQVCWIAESRPIAVTRSDLACDVILPSEKVDAKNRGLLPKLLVVLVVRFLCTRPSPFPGNEILMRDTKGRCLIAIGDAYFRLHLRERLLHRRQVRANFAGVESGGFPTVCQ